MRLLSVLAKIVLVASAVSFIASFPIQASYVERAQLIQRVQPDPAADLFGDAGTPIGSPQEMIIDDPKAFLEGTTTEGARLVSETYLKENQIYPLQLRTVDYVLGMVRIGSGVAFLAGVGALLLLKRRVRRGVPVPA